MATLSEALLIYAGGFALGVNFIMNILPLFILGIMSLVFAVAIHRAGKKAV